jgi:phosphoribosylaminoimidazole-succinocarboxamide synthase
MSNPQQSVLAELDDARLMGEMGKTLDRVDLDFLPLAARGKVREIYAYEDKLVLVTSDRLSAFDRILGRVPFKGQVLNQLAAFWFEHSRHIVDNHLIETPDPNVTIARRCMTLPVEVVVRGYITGVTQTSLWYRYSQGERTIYGMTFPDGMRKNEALPEPIITPTTKAHDGHDEQLTHSEIVERGIVAPALWEQVCDAAVRLFQFGQQTALAAQLILVDTKYEFGVTPDGNLLVIDEVHTPDSSRFWLAGSYAERLAGGQEPENFDKEFVRLYYAAHGYRGDGEPEPLPVELAIQAARRYIRTYEMLTGKPFEPGETPAAERIRRNLRAWVESR